MNVKDCRVSPIIGFKIDLIVWKLSLSYDFPIEDEGLK